MSDPAAASTQEEQGMVVDAPQVLENAPAAASGEQVATAEGAAPAAAESSSGVQVFHPSSATVPGPARAAPADDFFEPTVADLQRHQASIAGRSQLLNDAPLLTSKYRDADKAEKEKVKATRWPTTTIRIKFSDGTQIQNTFPSTSPIQPVYEFVRSALSSEAAAKAFTLSQPPHTMFPERPVPQTQPAKKPINPKMKAQVITPSNYGPVRGASTRGGTGGSESLSDLGLVPQSVLLVRWDDKDMNASAFSAPIKEELRAKAAPLPTPQAESQSTDTSTPPKKKLTGTGDKMPKWLAKGLMKKK